MTTVQKHASFAIDILSGEIRLQGAADPPNPLSETPATTPDPSSGICIIRRRQGRLTR